MKTRSFKDLSIMLLALAAIGLTGCNTMAGAGRDVEAAGEAIEEEAEEHRGY